MPKMRMALPFQFTFCISIANLQALRNQKKERPAGRSSVYLMGMVTGMVSTVVREYVGWSQTTSS